MILESPISKSEGLQRRSVTVNHPSRRDRASSQCVTSTRKEASSEALWIISEHHTYKFARSGDSKQNI